MLMTGKDYLDSIRDGRRVYVGSELVDDVTPHPAFYNAARSFAMIYDRKRAPENRDVMTFEEDEETFSTYFSLPHTREDLQRRFETHRRIAFVDAWFDRLIADNLRAIAVTGWSWTRICSTASRQASATTSATIIGTCARTTSLSRTQ